MCAGYMCMIVFSRASYINDRMLFRQCKKLFDMYFRNQELRLKGLNRIMRKFNQ